MANTSETTTQLNQLSQWWQQFWILKAQASERLSPLVEETRSIWSDPLWQFIGVIIIGLILIYCSFLILRFLAKKFLAFAEGSTNLIIIGLKNLIKKLINLKDKKGLKAKQQSKKGFWFDYSQVKKSLDTAKHLTTSNDWRYQTSWYLLTGAKDSKHSDWISSVRNSRVNRLLSRQKQLGAKGSGWHFFDHGVVIDIEDETSFKQSVDLINIYRPERPLDGIILTVSAKALLAIDKDKSELHNIGQDLYEKMWRIQKTTGFVLPVYFVVTECDVIEGFNSFWTAWSEQPAQEMFGWSNPTRFDAAFTIKWIQEAFVTVIENIRRTQLLIAANGNDIDDIDSFMVFDREFESLRLPLTEVIEKAFSRSSFQEAMPFRGLWFTGNIQEQSVLSEELFLRKIWPEKHLAYPLEQRFFSANKFLHNFQWASLIIGFLMIAAMVTDSFRLHSYTRSAEQYWSYIFSHETSHYCAPEGVDTWWLLSNLTKISEEPFTPALSGYWLGGQVPELRSAAAESIYPQFLFSNYKCRLSKKAERLNQFRNQHRRPIQEVDIAIDTLDEHIKALLEYETAKQQLVFLSGPLSDETNVATSFQELTKYLYDSEIPPTIDFKSPLLLGSVMDTHYDINLDPNQGVDINRYSAHLTELSRQVSRKIIQRALNPPVQAVKAAFSVSESESGAHGDISAEQMLDSVINFQRWLDYISADWLDSKHVNPCAKFDKQLRNLATTLSGFGYSSTLLKGATSQFSHENCEMQVLRSLEGMNTQPFGQIFVMKNDNTLDFSPALGGLMAQLADLVSLQFISQAKGTGTEHFIQSEEPTGRIIAWDNGPLNQALEMLLSFQDFRSKWWQSAGSGRVEPFYAPAVQARLQQAITQSIYQAQVTEYTPAVQDKNVSTSASSKGESDISASVTSFKRSSSLLRQLMTLLEQEGDSFNAILLQRQTDYFVKQQLQQLTELVEDNNLYTPLGVANWKSSHLAESLFNYRDPKLLANYLDNQRQRLSFMAHHYAEPLVAYLIDTQSIANTSNPARLWYDTLLEINEYDRQQLGNDVEQLQQYVADQLSTQTWNECQAILESPMVLSNGGLFSERHYDINQQVKKQCKRYQQDKVVRRYFALAERFNRDLKGQFPFAEYRLNGQQDIKASTFKAFFDDYQTLWAKPKTGKPLLEELAAYVEQYPQAGLEDWLTFVTRIDQFSQFYEYTKIKGGTLQVTLDIEFDTRLDSAQGQDQIIEWQVNSGGDIALFPNGKERIQWQPGQDLSLSLRWASGSEFQPMKNYQSSQELLPEATARFTADSPWALFQWLQQFGLSAQSSSYRNWLEFTVPVGLKPSAGQAATSDVSTQSKAAYLSRISIAISAIVSGSDGREIRLAIPSNLPFFAPGVSGSKSLAGEL